MPGRVGKLGTARLERARRPVGGSPGQPRYRQQAYLAAVAMLLGALSACNALHVQRTISLHTLEAAPATRPRATRRHIVSDPAALRPLYRPLGRRLGLIHVCDQDDWEQLARATPQIGHCPNLRRGIVVGLVSEAGTPLDGGWPFRWKAIRLHKGAGLIEADFNAGNYLPDGTTWLETAYVEGLKRVLVVSVDGSRHYPSEPGAVP